jgi:hypothetical protein
MGKPEAFSNWLAEMGDERSSSFLVGEIIWQHIILHNRAFFHKIIPRFSLLAFLGQNRRLKGANIY